MSSLIWRCADVLLELGSTPSIMGIINVTPDSFSDGGRFDSAAAAIARGLQLESEGATILDVGGESTRPNAQAVPLEVELERVVPVIRELARQSGVPISVDTFKPEVARQSLQAGARIINDVSGFRNPAMIATAKEFGAGMVVMHMQGTPDQMQRNPTYGDVVREVDEFFEERLQTFANAGIEQECVCLDPGIGFGKTLEHNLALLANLGSYSRFGRPICLGVSRKSFIGTICERTVDDRLAGSLAVASFALAAGEAHVLRVHDVPPHRDAVRLISAINRQRT